MSERQAANNRARPIQAVPTIEKPQAEFFNLPTSAAAEALLGVLGTGGDFKTLEVQQKRINRNTVISFNMTDNAGSILFESPNDKVRLRIADTTSFFGKGKKNKNSGNKKFFNFLLMKVNEQAFFNGQLTKDVISFPLQELVDIGFYKNTKTASVGFNNFIDSMAIVDIGGDRKNGANYDTFRGRHMIRTGDIVNKQCYILLDDLFPWGFMIRFYTKLPTYYFSLPSNASDLLQYIFYLARQNTKKIKEGDSFTIKLRTIQARLQLPTEIGNTRPRQTIREPIETAIEQIEAAQKAAYPVEFKDGERLEDKLEFSLSLKCKGYDNIDEAPIAAYLDSGYLEVTLKGNFAKTFIEISTKTAKQIEAANKKKERIAEAAIARNMAKKAEAENQTESETA